MITWSFVPAHTLIAELKPIISSHYAEITEGEPLNIDWDTYEAASKAGQAVAVTARDNEKLVGYIIFTVTRNLRHMHLIEATSSGWYVEPEYRGSLGIEILDKAEEFLKSAGVHKIQFILNGSVGELLKRNGFTPKYQVWSK